MNKISELRPQHQLEFNTVLMCKNNLKLTIKETIKLLSNNITNKDTKSRLKKRLTNYYDSIK